MSSNVLGHGRVRLSLRATICVPSPEQIRPHVPRRYVCLGTDGFGRSDYRVALRKFFEVNRHYIAVAALKSLADEGAISINQVETAIKKYRIDGDKPAPWKM